jgi:hypothetical protein
LVKHLINSSCFSAPPLGTGALRKSALKRSTIPENNKVCNLLMEGLFLLLKFTGKIKILSEPIGKISEIFLPAHVYS